jgi:hypothetical protein
MENQTFGEINAAYETITTHQGSPKKTQSISLYCSVTITFTIYQAKGHHILGIVFFLIKDNVIELLVLPWVIYLFLQDSFFTFSHFLYMATKFIPIS